MMLRGANVVLMLGAVVCTGAGIETPRGPAAPLGLPPIPFPLGNPYSAASVELGRDLFFDGRLSSNGEVPCASCHQPGHGFSDSRPFSVGVNGKLSGRHAPTLINRAWGKSEFWDGRAPDLEAQVIIPITNPNEMNMTAEQVVTVIRSIAGYAPLFASAYGDPNITFDRVSKALANFVRTIVSGNSAYDRYMAGDKSALTKEQKRGMEFFNGKGECADPMTARTLLTKSSPIWGSASTNRIQTQGARM